MKNGLWKPKKGLGSHKKTEAPSATAPDLPPATVDGFDRPRLFSYCNKLTTQNFDTPDVAPQSAEDLMSVVRAEGYANFQAIPIIEVKKVMDKMATVFGVPHE